MQTDRAEPVNDQLAQAAALSHTPDSLARALLSELYDKLTSGAGSTDDAVVQLTVRAREVMPAATDSGGHGIIEICIATGGGHGYCVYWPPPLPIVIQ